MNILVNVIVGRVFPILLVYAALTLVRSGHDFGAAALIVMAYSLAENSGTP